MAINLGAPLEWKKARDAVSPDSAGELAMLHDLQGNILKSHGRRNTENLFISFNPAMRAEACAFVASVAQTVTTALDQLNAAEPYRKTKEDGGPFVSLMLTANGYKVLGQHAAIPPSVAFEQGMAQRDLGDPPAQLWQPHFGECLHALILLGAMSPEVVLALRAAMNTRIDDTRGAVSLIGVETGLKQTNADDRAIEHFGYVDGRSQPLALVEDFETETDENGGTNVWDPTVPLGQFLAPCPGGMLDVSHGSFFVFRKLEQNVFAFKTMEKAVGEANGNIGERAGASLVGRYENGFPITALEHTPATLSPGMIGVSNNFTYDSDQDGLRCPFAAHIRKTNPRFPTGSMQHLMARRGIPYGVRYDGLNDDQLDNKPRDDVGLLFMAYQSDLEDQFEFTQHIWANNPDFENTTPATGRDPIIGQPTLDIVVGAAADPIVADKSAVRIPDVYNVSLGEPFHFGGFVKMKGGAYFFAPSISFLKNVH